MCVHMYCKPSGVDPFSAQLPDFTVEWVLLRQAKTLGVKRCHTDTRGGWSVIPALATVRQTSALTYIMF
jgi:hypothetical protein